MNKMVNSNFTGDSLRSVNIAGLPYDSEMDIYKGLACFSARREDFTDAKDEDEMKLVKALIHIEAGTDVDEEIAEFLDRIDSVLIYHLKVEDMTKRELLCLFLNQICEWSVIFKNDNNFQNDNKIYKLSDLYSEFKEFVLEKLGLPRRRILEYTKFREHLRHHATVKPSHYSFHGTELTAESVCGFDHKKFF